MRSIFVNLPVKNLDASKAFFAALGFTFNAQFTDEAAACMVIEENIYAMLLTEPRFGDFITGPISDAHKATEVLLCLSAESREDVDAILAKAFAAGAKPWKPVTDMGVMYGGTFQDLDGHVWEPMWIDPAMVTPPA